MSKNKNPNFFEPRTIIAFALTMLVFVLWQNYMKKKYPHVYSSNIKKEQNLKTDKAEIVKKDNPEKPVESTTNIVNQKILTPDEAPKNYVEVDTPFSSEKWSAEVSNLGLEFKTTHLKEYKQRSLENVFFKDLFKTSFFGLSEPIPFEVEKVSDTEIKGTFENEKGKIIKVLKFNPTNYSVEANYEIQGEFPGLSVFIETDVNKDIKSSFLMPSFDRQEYVVISSEGENRDALNSDEFATRSFSQVKLLALGSQFFSNAIVDRSSLKPNAVVYSTNSNKTVTARLDYEFSKELKTFQIAQIYFAGPKDDVILKSVDKDMFTLINFGIFEIICEPILQVLKFFYSIFSNYGVAIIFLTLLMRLLVFPIAYRGYKSMDKMQKIQPQLKVIREKYKDDSQKANLETMALMKQEKVNPIGGCLPMLLQLPIFFAYYRVLSESIVMYQAPFALWITDLSLKDPYYVLPFLMGLTMFVQQKLTPTALEPMQQRVMLFMPLIFSIFMISLPSALTLYIFVSTLFGVIQQYLFTKSKTDSVARVRGV